MKRMVLVSAILSAIANGPICTNKTLQSSLRPYCRGYSGTSTCNSMDKQYNCSPSGRKNWVVFYGKSLPMVETAQSAVAGDIKKLAAGKKVIFTVCVQAMRIHKVEKNMLIPGVRTLPGAIYELIAKQADGYGYIKVTN